MEQEEDVLSYALFPQVAMKFFEARKAAGTQACGTRSRACSGGCGSGPCTGARRRYYPVCGGSLHLTAARSSKAKGLVFQSLFTCLEYWRF